MPSLPQAPAYRRDAPCTRLASRVFSRRDVGWRCALPLGASIVFVRGGGGVLGDTVRTCERAGFERHLRRKRGTRRARVTRVTAESSQKKVATPRGTVSSRARVCTGRGREKEPASVSSLFSEVSSSVVTGRRTVADRPAGRTRHVAESKRVSKPAA